MTETSLKSLICPAFYDLHRSIKNKESTKSSFISIEIILNLLKDPQANAVCYRKVSNKIEDSVYNQIRWAVESLGITKFFKFSKSPFKVVYTPTGQQILFKGLDDPDNSKSIKPPHGYNKILWFEELKQFDGMKEIRDVKQSVIRGGDEALIFYSYNPPEDPKNWVNKEARQVIQTRKVHHSTYLDVNPEWLGQPFFLTANELKENNPLAYKNEYLGEEVGTGLTVFPNVKVKTIPIEEIRKFSNICEGIDWGYAIDPFVWLKLHYDRKYKIVYIFDEIYRVGLSNDDAISLVNKKHQRGVEIIADSEEPKSVDEFDNAGLPIRGAKKGAGSVSFGIKKLQGMKSIMIDPERCPNAAREFSEYSLELNRDETIKSKFPDKDNHAIDAVRYSLEDEFDY